MSQPTDNDEGSEPSEGDAAYFIGIPLTAYPAKRMCIFCNKVYVSYNKLFRYINNCEKRNPLVNVKKEMKRRL